MTNKTKDFPKAGVPRVKPIKVKFDYGKDGDAITVMFSDGEVHSCWLDVFPWLTEADGREHLNWEIRDDAIVWPGLGRSITAAEFFREFPRTRDVREQSPFKVGDLVELKSGGFQMMVEDVRGMCRPPESVGDVDRGSWKVDVVFAGMKTGDELSRDTLPAACLQLVPIEDGKPRRPIISLYDNVPF